MKMKMISFNGQPMSDFEASLIKSTQIAATSMVGLVNSMAAHEMQARMTYDKLESERNRLASFVINLTAVDLMSENLRRVTSDLNVLLTKIEEARARMLFPWLAGGLLLVLCVLVAAQVVR